MSGTSGKTCLYPTAQGSGRVPGAPDWDKKILPQATLNTVQVFLLIFFMLAGLGTLTMAAVGLSPFEAISVTLAALTNVGPAFESFGPTCNYTSLPAFAKMFLAFYMLLGRLELMSVLVIFTRGFWRK